MNVIDEIVNNNLCVGCGICATICPQEALKIQFNKYGEYVPVQKADCNSECGLCLKVCPFNGENEDENKLGSKLYGNIKEIKYLPETGYYLDSYVGYSDEFRHRSASGGMATWLLTTLLQKKIVDYAICVTSQKNPDKLFKFEIFNSVDSIIASSGSAYYPVEISQVIKKVLETPGRYAITGLPCFLKGLRLASQKNKKLKDRIIITVGIVCGQMKSKHYTEYLSALANANGRPQNVYYRGKSPDRPANNYYFQCTDEKGSTHKIFWNEGVSEAWGNRWFTPNACNYCDDIFAELADVTFMDAWLPEYSKNPLGTNLMIVRSPLINNLVNYRETNQEIKIEKIPISEIIQSQKGVIETKRSQLPYRLYLAHQQGLKVPTKRIKTSDDVNRFIKQDIKIKNCMQKESRNKFCDYFDGQTLCIKKFRRKMDLYLHIRKCYKLTSKILHHIF